MIRRRAAIALVIVLSLLGTATLILRQAGAWLIVEDPIQASPVLVVLGGRGPLRSMEGARLYKQGVVHEIWLTKGAVSADEIELRKLGIEFVQESTYSRMLLERLEVPAAAIRMLPDRNENTAQEVRTVARELNRAGYGRVIIVTSSYHTRRVKALWRKLVGEQPQLIVRYTPEDPVNPYRWWRDSADGMAITREWFGLFNAWAGFPVRSEHW